MYDFKHTPNIAMLNKQWTFETWKPKTLSWIINVSTQLAMQLFFINFQTNHKINASNSWNILQLRNYVCTNICETWNCENYFHNTNLNYISFLQYTIFNLNFVHLATILTLLNDIELQNNSVLIRCCCKFALSQHFIYFLNKIQWILYKFHPNTFCLNHIIKLHVEHIQYSFFLCDIIKQHNNTHVYVFTEQPKNICNVIIVTFS